MTAKFKLPLAMGLVLALAHSPQALAHHGKWWCNPYKVVKHCDSDGGNCRVRMTYRAGQSLSSSPRHSHWYGMLAPTYVSKRVCSKREIVAEGHIVTTSGVCHRHRYHD